MNKNNEVRWKKKEQKLRERKYMENKNQDNNK